MRSRQLFLGGVARTLLASVLAASVLAVTACNESSTKPSDQPPVTGRVADFSLTDVNPNSPTSGEAISPRSYLHTISAWYFGHST